ncbi:ABC-type transport system involved in Fe-S cluster assembly fused permease/ATPase subunit [Inquilinus ginsengisoli]|uniref:ABCB family ABC transporter ATP-binding protein/permease n=1 Tax=Inquilinus ginsengisoli TaxID=363840 RepID=UPI003D196766
MAMTPPRGDHSARGDLATLGRVMPYLWRGESWGVRLRILACVALVFLSSFAVALVPLLFSLAIDAYAGKANTWAVGAMGVITAYAVASWVGRILGELQYAAYGPIEHRLVRRLSRTFFTHLHGLSLRFHLGRRTGAVSEDLGRGLAGIRELIYDVAFRILPLLIEIAATCVILLAHLPPFYALVTAATLAAFAWAMTLGADNLRTTIRTMNRESSSAHAVAIDSLINYETVKYFGAEGAIGRRYDERLEEVERLAARGLALRSLNGIAQMTVLSVGLAILLILGGQAVQAGTMSVGDLVLLNTYFVRLARPLEQLSRLYRVIRNSLGSVEQMFALLDEAPEVTDAAGAVPLPPGNGALVFEHVSFAYDPRRPILRDVSFTLPAGRTVAVVGASGAGKSTIARLLFRFYDPSEGRILMDGQDLRDITQASLRAAIAVVPQDTVLLNETLFDNLVFGRPEATQGEVEAAARIAQLDRFVAGLPDGWDTRVGERGLKLSGGEKQRVAIARAVLKQPRLFIFDEATSSLDSATEQAIQERLAEASRGTSTLIIAHRLSTVVHADEILVLDRGRIAERGSHVVLLARDGLYAALWQRQHRVAEPAAE